MCPQLARPSLRDAPRAMDPTAEWLDAATVARDCGWSLRTAQRRIAGWQRDGWPRVKREATDSRKWRLLVERASFELYCRGVIDPPPANEAADAGAAKAA